MRAAAIVLVAATLLASPLAASEPTQRAFEAATALEARGQFAAAADALERIGHDQPADAFAADALYEAAVVAEDHLADPGRAHRLYEEVATRYPSSRLSRRARTRADFLAQSLSTGEGPLREYQEILNGASARPRAASRAAMVALLTQHPDFALADRALFWLGQRLAEDHLWSDAAARYAELEQRFPSSEWALRAKKARADLLLAGGHPLVARALYRELVGSPDALARSAGAEGLADAATWIARGMGVAGAVIYLIVFAALQLRALGPRRRLRRMPLELTYYGPVALLFVVAAMTENRAIGWATSGIALGGAALVWLTSLSAAARLERGPLPATDRAGRAAAVVVAVVAITFLSVQATGLTDIVVETLRAGPERG